MKALTCSKNDVISSNK